MIQCTLGNLVAKLKLKRSSKCVRRQNRPVLYAVWLPKFHGHGMNPCKASGLLSRTQATSTVISYFSSRPDAPAVTSITTANRVSRMFPIAMSMGHSRAPHPHISQQQTNYSEVTAPGSKRGHVTTQNTLVDLAPHLLLGVTLQKV